MRKGQKHTKETMQKMKENHRSKNGYEPWNKGTKHICKSNSGSFKKNRILSDEVEAKRLRNLRITNSTLIGVKHPKYKEKIIHPSGYISIHFNDGKRRYILEHRFVMEKMIGRKLTKEEVVHHIDGNKQNNSIDNLKLFSNKSEHAKEHRRIGGKHWG